MTDDSSLAQALQAKHDENTPPSTQPTATTSSSSNGKSNGFDISSFESFPTLGGSNKASPSLNAAWGSPSTSQSQSSPSYASNNNKNQALNTVKSSTTSSMFTLQLTPQQKQDKNLIPELLARVQKLGNVNVDSSTSRVTGTTTFIIRGTPLNVERARRDIKKELAVKVSKTVQVPASVRASIIGPKGSNLKPIIEKSGCNIQVSRNDAKNKEELDEDEEELVDVIIEGDNEGIQVAVDEIMSIVKSKVRDLTSKIQVEERIKQFVLKEFGNINGLKISDKDKENGGPLVLSGERTLVLDTKQKIDQFAVNASQQYAAASVPIAPVKQQFLNGKEIFDNTGVAVFFADPNVTIFGPPNKLSNARDFITSKANGLNILSLDISRAHDKNIKHAENLALYMKNSKKLKEIELSNNVQVKIPSSFNGTDVTVEIVGNDAEQIKTAKKQVVLLVNSLPPSHVVRVEDIDEFFKPHVAKLAKKLQAEYWVNLNMTDPVVLVYEGNPKQDEDDFAPGAAEIQETLKNANDEFNDIRSKQGDISSITLSVPSDDHKYIYGPNNTTMNVLIGQAMATIQVGKNTPTGEKDSVFIRGLKDEVDRISKEIDQVIHEGKNYEELSKYTTEFQFPTEHVNKLIGKQGANLTKLREEFGVKIEVDEHGHGTVRGIKKNADEAKARIISQGKRMADETTERLNIPSDKHAVLIGQGGKFVKRLEDRYDVRIRFPRQENTGENSNDRDAPKHKNEVVLRGPSRGVAKVREELLDLLKYEEEHSYSETIKVPSKALPRIIGRNGERINEIKDNTDTKIDVAHEEEGEDISITIVGTKKGVKEAVESIQSVAREIIDTVSETVSVDPKYHKLLIGPGGSTMREIISKACGDDALNNQRMMDIPRAGSSNWNVTVTGNKKYVSKVVKRINEIVDEQKSFVEEAVDVAPERHGALIGPGGVVKRDIEDSCKVTMNVPKQNSGKRDIILVGKREGVDKAKAKILQLTVSQIKAEVVVPRKVHADLADRGTFVRRLRNEFDVRVEHGREKLPKNSENVAPPAEAIGEVLITDDEQEAASKFKWTVVGDEDKGEEEEGTIPWKLKGSEENCQRAKECIEKALEQCKKHDHTGYLWLGDPSRYKLVIGSGGSNINTIRDKSGCTVTVPKNGKSMNECIVVRGSRDQLEVAKDMILQSVQ